jgi:hypothetical protein
LLHGVCAQNLCPLYRTDKNEWVFPASREWITSLPLRSNEGDDGINTSQVIIKYFFECCERKKSDTAYVLRHRRLLFSRLSMVDGQHP